MFIQAKLHTKRVVHISLVAHYLRVIQIVLYIYIPVYIYTYLYIYMVYVLPLRLATTT